MNLIADRFLELDAARVVDLATGADVRLVRSASGGQSDELRWASRCGRFSRLFHPLLARLLDYGGLGESRRFEAWEVGQAASAPWQRDAADAVRSASRFLAACGLTGIQGAQDAASPVLVPGPADGYPETRCGDDRDCPVEDCGIVAIERRAVTSVIEVFDPPRTGNAPGVLCLWGPAGSGRATAMREVARAARLSGFVPVHVAWLDAAGDLLDGRVVCVLDDGQARWRRGLLDLLSRSPRSHVVVCTSHEDLPGVPSFALGRVDTQTLIDAVRPRALATDPRVRRAAERAAGSPERFARLLCGHRYDQSEARRSVGRAAERAPTYGPGPHASSLPPQREPIPWPDAGELRALRQQVDAGVRLLAAGRHAPGDRVVRRAIGGLARRGDHAAAADASLALATSLLRRGRPREARATLDTLSADNRRAANDRTAVAVAMLHGVALTDLGRLDEAESVLAAVEESALADGEGAVRSALALARCRFWQGRYADAIATLDAVERRISDRRQAIAWHAIRARVAVGAADLPGAIAAAAESVRLAQDDGDPRALAPALCAAAFAHLAVGDAGAVARDVAACVDAARAGRDPLRAFRARLLLAEQCRRDGGRSLSAGTIKTLSRMASARLPLVLKSRYDLWRDLLTGDVARSEDRDGLVARHVASSGLPALALFAPRAPVMSVHAGVVDDMLAVLRACQEAEEDANTLAAVCGMAQRRLDAVAVAFFGVEHGQPVRLAGSGARLDAAIAARAIEAMLPIAPHRLDDRVEAAAPVRYGGATIGALAARWLPGRLPDQARAVPALTMAATAAAPVVHSVLVGRAATQSSPTHGLLGVSRIMADVRRAADRAASAPFSVLIEGESGSGKELVARAVHRGSSRRDRPFRTLNCAALPDELVESELFGHARGAFTGAMAERVGVFEEAHSGTLMLDEIGELSLRAQAKLLRVLQEGELRRIGENASRRIDVRIVSATNRNLRDEVAAGRFRLDLLYRLDVIRIVLPPLRDRREDIPLLVDHVWREAAARIGSQASLGTATVAALARYDWPGNVRELQNVLAALAVRAGRRGVVGPAALPPQFGAVIASDDCRLDAARRAFDERFVRAALVRTGGNRVQAASDLGISRQGLSKLMARLGIDGDAVPASERPP
jgi:DNA-binding NtrC family response regulator/tetratricopeptide (TPR) repeat protein